MCLEAPEIDKKPPLVNMRKELEGEVPVYDGQEDQMSTADVLAAEVYRQGLARQGKRKEVIVADAVLRGSSVLSRKSGGAAALEFKGPSRRGTWHTHTSQESVLLACRSCILIDGLLALSFP